MMKRSLWNSVAASLSYCSSSSSSPSAVAAANVLKNGDALKQSRVFSVADNLEYSKLTLDSNPLHFDSEMARNCGFADVIVPGLLVASLFPRIIASHFPGAVYVKQSLEFRSPVFVGDEIIGEVKATNIRHTNHKFMVKFITTCFKDGGTVVIGGEAIAVLPSLTVKQVSHQ